MAKPSYPGLVLVPPSDRSIFRRRLARLAVLITAVMSCALAITHWLPSSGKDPNCQLAPDDREFPDSRQECAQSDLSVTKAESGQSASRSVEVARAAGDPGDRANVSSGRTMTAASYRHPDARLAHQGDAFAQYRFGRFLAQRGEPHAQESVHWYRKASDGLRRLAEAGNGQAMYVLGVMNAFGRGIERDTEQARQWLTQAVERQVEAARPVLGRLEKHRNAIPRDAQPKVVDPRAADAKGIKPQDARQKDADPRDAKPRDATPLLQAKALFEKVRHEN